MKAADVLKELKSVCYDQYNKSDEVRPIFSSIPKEHHDLYLSVKGALNILKSQRCYMTRAFYKKKGGNDPLLVYNTECVSHAKAEVLFHKADVIPFKDSILDSLAFIIVTRSIDAFSFQTHGIVWGELLHQHDSSGLSFTRFDDLRETVVKRENLLVDKEGAYICISSAVRNDGDSLIILPEDIVDEIEVSVFQAAFSSNASD